MDLTLKQKSSRISGADLQECLLIDLKENKDARGSFTEIFQQSWDTGHHPVQWSVVKSEKHVFRGMHYHKRHHEHFCIIEGSCYLGLKDMRPRSSTYLESAVFFLCDTDLKSLVFPSGVLHGWYFLTKAVHIQSVSESYVDYGKEDNFGCRWDDPALNIEWPFTDVILSEKAEAFRPFRELPPFEDYSF
jgi:dTDP-4-dehydrorhamnose 3,5-epimerase